MIMLAFLLCIGLGALRLISSGSCRDLSDHGRGPTPVPDGQMADDDPLADSFSPHDLNQNDEKIPYKREEIDYFLNHILESPVHRYQTRRGKVMDISKLTKFAGVVDPESLHNAIYSTVGLYMAYEHYMDNGTIIIVDARGTAFFMNLTHLFTARHNLYNCIHYPLGDSKSQPCDHLGKQSKNEEGDELYYMQDLLVSRKKFDGDDGDAVNIDERDSTISHPKYNKEKDINGFYGDSHTFATFDRHYVDDVAIVMSPERPVKKKLSKNSYHIANLEPFDETKCFDQHENGKYVNKHPIMVVGYPPVLRDNETAILKDGQTLNAREFNKFFNGGGKGGRKPVFGISDKGTGYLDGDFVIHKVPIWGGFSGSCIYCVDDTGIMYGIGIHVAGTTKFNWGVLFSHEFFSHLIIANFTTRDVCESGTCEKKLNMEHTMIQS